MKYIFTKGERLAVSVIIAQLEGVNRTDARLISKVDEHLELDEVQAGVPIINMGDRAEFELAVLEVEWIQDHINKCFDKQKVPPFIAKHVLSLENKFKPELIEEEKK